MNEAVGRLFTLAGLIVFVGIGALGWKIGDTWSSADTQAVITASAMVCGGGIVVFGAFAAVIIGVPLSRRLSGDSMPRPPLDLGAPQRRQLPQSQYGPPMLTAYKDDATGAWQGGGAVDIWDDVSDAMTWDGK